MATKKPIRKNTKATGDRVANTASRLLRTSNDPLVLSIAASAVSQSQRGAQRRPRGDRRVRRPRPAQFKAGKDLRVEQGGEDPQEGGTT